MHFRKSALLIATTLVIAGGCDKAAEFAKDLTSPSDKPSQSGAAEGQGAQQSANSGSTTAGRTSTASGSSQAGSTQPPPAYRTPNSPTTGPSQQTAGGGQPQPTSGTQQPPSSLGASSSTSGTSERPTAQSFPVRLSQGIALEQTGPTGPIMLFSVTYRFVGELPNPESQYALVIEQPRGSAMGRPYKLQSEGTFQSIAEGVRTRDGPFTAHLVEITADQTRRVVSDRISLR